jgi:BlaI family penicillinase repressor
LLEIPATARSPIVVIDIRLQSEYLTLVARSQTKTFPARPLPSAAELDILAVLWRRGPSTVREVHEALGKDSIYNTTLKQMVLMTEKGLLVRSERFRSHVYEAGAPQEQTQRQIAGDLLMRAFGGSARGLVLGALAARPASSEDLEEIQRILDTIKKRRGSR